MSLSNWYTQQFDETLSEKVTESDGISEIDLNTLLAGQQIPQSLHDYYRVAGRHWMNSNFERLLAPDQLRCEGDYLVFMDENQNVGQWGFKRDEAQELDPNVYCGIWSKEELVWYAEEKSLSQFIISMWLETCTGDSW